MSSKNKLFAIIASVAMLAGMLAFGAVPSLAGTIQIATVTVPTFTSSVGTQPLGTMAVTGIPSAPATQVANGEVLKFELPSDFTVESYTYSVPTNTQGNANGVAYAGAAGTAIPGSAAVTVAGTTDSAGKWNQTIFSVPVTMNTSGNLGEVDVTITASVGNPSNGDVSVLVSDSFGAMSKTGVTVGTVASGSASVTTPRGTSTIAQGGGAETIAEIDITENVANAISSNSNHNVTITLPSDYSWALTTYTPTYVSGDLLYPNGGDQYNGSATNYTVTTTTNGSGLSELIIAAKGAAPSTGAYSGPGEIEFNNLTVKVPTDATGTLNVTLGHAASGTLAVATVGTYGVTVSAESTPTVYAGAASAGIGDIDLVEGLANSFLPGRTVTLTLPSGVTWDPGNLPQSNTTSILGDGSNNNVTQSNLNSDDTVLTYTVPSGWSESGASTVKLQNANVNIDPSAAAGPLTITVGGTSGVSGTVTVANIEAPVTVSASATPNVILGKTDQAAGDVTITESGAGALVHQQTINGTTSSENLLVSAPDNVNWSNTPTVTVTSGNLELGTPSTSGSVLTIPIKTGSTTASTIKISGINLDVQNIAFTGPVNLKVKGDPVVGLVTDESITGSNAYTVPAYTGGSVASVTVAEAVTAAASNGSATFTIGATVYTAGGVQNVMDVAPFIQNGRTYVPVRYLAYALGLTDSGIVWDAATQTVTLTMGSTTVVLTIGSNVITVNGTAQTMDVAPMIVNGRTMLPARYVAQAFGYQVGWNPVSQEVLISK